MRVIENGPCLNCKKHIEYGSLSITNRKNELQWYESILLNWNGTHIDYVSQYGALVNGVSPRSVKPYLCEDCYSIIRHNIKQAREDKSKKHNTEIRQQREYYANLAKQSQYIDWEILRKEAYNTFLQSDYWKAVKQAKIKEVGKHCEQCNSSEHLQLHHVTYIHHGIEHKHLDDLKLLCEDCHKHAHKIEA